jgi:aromatic ring-opening dioxygenase LigB subunit
MYIGLHVKYPLLLSDFNETSSYLDTFPKNSQILNFMKIRPVGAKLSYGDERTDKSLFATLRKAPKRRRSHCDFVRIAISTKHTVTLESEVKIIRVHPVVCVKNYRNHVTSNTTIHEEF